MCGRVDIHTPPSELARVLEAQLAAGVDPEGSPSWNVGPTKGLPAVVEDAESDTKILDIFRWGLVPHFMKDPKAGGYKMINARADSVATKPAYRQALQKRRCLVVVDGFYEWAVEDASLPKSKQTKQPYYFRRADGAPITFAGLYEFWTDKSGSGPGSEQGTVLQTCVIITTDAGPDMTDVHDRMPVIIEPADRDRWLDRTVEDVALI
ncbi:MAG TPA: SOS response-associated peptidase, partial [Acidimicrobiales bacterium]|nr:SOS response-associated peptidase [Acidimicrobiales bacterium]